MKLIVVVALAGLFMALPTASAEMMMPNALPAERLIKNVNTYLEKHPNDASAYYTLGRIHYVSFANKVGFVPTYSNNSDTGKSLPGVEPYPSQGVYGARIKKAKEDILKQWDIAEKDIKNSNREKFWEATHARVQQLIKEGYPPELSTQELFDHASKSELNFQKAIKLDPDKGLYYLSLASFYHQYLTWQKNTPTIKVAGNVPVVTLDKARETAYTAFKKSYKQDYNAAKKSKSVSGMGGIVSNEAGKSYIDWAEPNTQKTEQEKKRIKFIKQHIDRMSKFPMWITPIVFTLDEHDGVNDLLQPTLSVTYDLDGDGNTEAWPWLKPSTALLVWDPEDTGRITSGRQLFGSATWWMLFSDGYRAMESLDDNLDGALSGEELAGISAWFDRNSDGISQPGEVSPLHDHGIVSIATTASDETQGMLMNPHGITLEDGRVLPSYDWVTTPSDKTISLPLRLR